MVKIIKGVYGYMTKNGTVKPKTSADEPFALTEVQEARLVALGVAEYVSAAPAAAPEARKLPAFDATMKVEKLRAIAKEMGITFKLGTTKTEMVEAMDRFLVDGAGTAEDADDIEADGAEPPAFDPAEAVEG